MIAGISTTVGLLAPSFYRNCVSLPISMLNWGALVSSWESVWAQQQGNLLLCVGGRFGLDGGGDDSITVHNEDNRQHRHRCCCRQGGDQPSPVISVIAMLKHQHLRIGRCTFWHFWAMSTTAGNERSQSLKFHNHREAPSTFCLLKVPTIFTFKIKRLC